MYGDWDSLIYLKTTVLLPGSPWFPVTCWSVPEQHIKPQTLGATKGAVCPQEFPQGDE